MEWPPGADILLILLQAGLTIAVVIIQWVSTADEKRTNFALAMRLLAIAGALALAVLTLYRSGEQTRAVAAADKRSDDIQRSVDAVRAFQGDPDLLKEVLTLHHQGNQVESQEDAEKFVAQFMQDLPARRNEQLSRTERAQRLVNRLRVQIEPVVDQLLTTFDSRMDALEKQNVRVQQQRSDIPTVLASEASRWKESRRVILPDNSIVTIAVRPGFVDERGEFNGWVSVSVSHRPGSTEIDVVVIQLQVSDTEVKLGGNMATLTEATLTDATAMVALRKSLREAIDRLVGRLMVDQKEVPATR